MSEAPAPAPAQPKSHKFRRGCLFTLLGVFCLIVLIIIISVAVGGGSSSTGTTSTNTNTNTGAGQAAGIGSQVRDGKFQFTVTKVTHAKNIGGSFGQTAQGRYTILHITVTNIGTEAQNLDDSAQFVFDGAGRKFSADSTADIYANGSSNSVFFNQINPGNTVHGKIAFDLPVGDTAVKVELHDSQFSGGVTVSLR